MSRKYRIHNQREVYFVTFTTVQWIDVFTRDEYKEIFVESVKYCQQHKGLEVYAWVIMTNHIHMIIGTTGSKLQDLIRDLKSFTSQHIRLAIENSTAESRKGWLLWMFGKAGVYNRNNIDWQMWQQHNHPIALDTDEKTMQRLNYLHENPVRAGFVTEATHWKWSSAYDYDGGKGLIDIIFIN
ncbi:MAG TPA: transposase [Flavipsychrobacter sp.]|nr:transposase [Flavipsychrobacter sp.]